MPNLKETGMQLFAHQIEAQTYLKARPKCLLAHEPGTGKTLAVLEYIRTHPGKWLIMAPKSTLESVWAADAHKIGVSPLICTGKVLPPPSSLIFKYPRITITNYEQYLRHAAAFHKAGYDRLVIDESSRLKNYKAKLSKTVRRYAKHWSHCICLSGTPAPNGSHEYFTQLFAIGSTKAGFWEWINSSHEPVYAYLGIRRVIKGWKLRESTTPVFAAMLGERCWRLKKADCLDLPPVTHLKRIIDLGTESMKQYRMARDELKVEIAAAPHSIPTYARFMKLRQLSAGWAYVPNDPSKRG